MTGWMCLMECTVNKNGTKLDPTVGTVLYQKYWFSLPYSIFAPISCSISELFRRDGSAGYGNLFWLNNKHFNISYVTEVHVHYIYVGKTITFQLEISTKGICGCTITRSLLQLKCLPRLFLDGPREQRSIPPALSWSSDSQLTSQSVEG